MDDLNENDSLFENAAELVVRCQSASPSLLQLRLKVGYMRANRIMNQLESAGIVTELNKSMQRTVKLPDAFSLKEHLKSL